MERTFSSETPIRSPLVPWVIVTGLVASVVGFGGGILVSSSSSRADDCRVAVESLVETTNSDAELIDKAREVFHAVGSEDSQGVTSALDEFERGFGKREALLAQAGERVDACRKAKDE